MERGTLKWAAGAILLIFVFAAGSVVLTKKPWVDEAWFAGPALELVTQGRMGTPLLDPAGSHLRLYNPTADLRGINQRTYWVMPVHLLQLAAWAKIFGFSIISMRAPSVFWGLIALVSVGVLVRRLYPDRRAALIAMAVLAVDFGFVDSSADVRMDMTCAALGFASLAIYLSWREERLSMALLISHSLAAAACFTHPNGSFATATLLVTMAWLDRHRWREMNPLLILIPYAAGGLGWWFYVRQAPGDFTAQMSANAAGRGGDLLTPWRGIWREIDGRFMTHYWPEGSWSGRLKVVGLLLALVSGAAILAVRPLRAVTGCRLLVCLAVLRFVMLSVAANAKFTYYMVHIVPFFAAMIGIAAAYAWADERRWTRATVTGALAAYFVVQGAALWHKTVTVSGYRQEYQPLVAYLKSVARPDDEIVGSAELGFGLGFDNPRLADDVWLGYWSHRRPTIVVVDRRYYKEVIEVATQRGFPAPGYFQQLLGNEFRLIETFKDYQVYRRGDGSAPNVRQ
jgi:4-amino-4-deoxy-L-arabinose transferase-like glycosyltransferase